MAASDSEIDENAIHDVEADLLESIYIYVTEGQYQEGVSANQKRVIQKKAVNFRIVNGEILFQNYSHSILFTSHYSQNYSVWPNRCMPSSIDNAKQKHSGCEKGKANQKQQLSDYE